MQCFICVTYLMIICSAYPPKTRDDAKYHEKRSLFRDVIESLRIRAQLPEDLSPNDENNLSQSYERYGYENEPLQLPGDSEFMPRRNDRIEMPSLKYRFPKSMNTNESSTQDTPKEEVVVYIETPSDTPVKATTLKPKKQKRPRPPINKKPNKNKDNEDTEEPEPNEDKPFNTLAGQSQIGNRESQTVVKPTVIVNFRGTVTHRESEIRLERRDNNNTRVDIPQNVFNIKQEIKLERADASMGVKDKKPSFRQDVKVTSENEKPKIEEDMMMCETNSWKDKNERSGRKYDVLQILFSI
ncbi:uncharacterized protein [Epargyreus clarus]|uniref:uncharacterized protein n=1 Tax=Epargyreus clarus TaxID=520877 RepID=UPI003C30E025